MDNYQDIDNQKCPRCGSEMWPENDHTNMVNVLVCTKPTCLYRVYPDYPRRNGNQEICYLCGKMFIVHVDDLGVLCQPCKRTVSEYKQKSSEKYRKHHKPIQSRNVLHI